MKSLTKCVVASFLACIIFTVVVLILAIKDIEVSDQLINSFFLVFGVEFGAAAGIKITKTVVNKHEKDNYISNLKENDFPIEKKDLKEDDSDDYYDGGIYG